MKGTYVDGFLLVVPKDKVNDYKKMAQKAKKIWLKYGALDYKECMGDDLEPSAPGGPKPRTFIAAARAKEDETVWFSYIVYKNRKHRDSVNAKVMKDPAMNDPNWEKKGMPFDMKRMCFGGFKVEVGI